MLCISEIWMNINCIVKKTFVNFVFTTDSSQTSSSSFHLHENNVLTSVSVIPSANIPQTIKMMQKTRCKNEDKIAQFFVCFWFKYISCRVRHYPPPLHYSPSPEQNAGLHVRLQYFMFLFIDFFMEIEPMVVRKKIRFSFCSKNVKFSFTKTFRLVYNKHFYEIKCIFG